MKKDSVDIWRTANKSDLLVFKTDLQRQIANRNTGKMNRVRSYCIFCSLARGNAGVLLGPYGSIRALELNPSEVRLAGRHHACRIDDTKRERIKRGRAQ